MTHMVKESVAIFACLACLFIYLEVCHSTNHLSVSMDYKIKAKTKLEPERLKTES